MNVLPIPVNQLIPHRFHVTEGIAGTFHYHISNDQVNARGLCGAETMVTAIPLSVWGVRGHLNEHWCEACVAKAIAWVIYKDLPPAEVEYAFERGFEALHDHMDANALLEIMFTDGFRAEFLDRCNLVIDEVNALLIKPKRETQ